jgi:hypothetical protein
MNLVIGTLFACKDQLLLIKGGLHITPPFFSILKSCSNYLPFRHGYCISDEGSGGQHEAICLKSPGDTAFIICDNTGAYLALREKRLGDVKCPLSWMTHKDLRSTE